MDLENLSWDEIITEEEIVKVFVGTNFGESINSSTSEKKKLIIKSLRNKMNGFWVGHTVYHILIRLGLIYPDQTYDKTLLTLKGLRLLEVQQSMEIIQSIKKKYILQSKGDNLCG